MQCLVLGWTAQNLLRRYSLPMAAADNRQVQACLHNAKVLHSRSGLGSFMTPPWSALTQPIAQRTGMRDGEEKVDISRPAGKL